MKTKLLITLTEVSLLALACTQSALLAQDGAILLTLKGGWASASEPVRKVQVVGPYAYLVVRIGPRAGFDAIAVQTRRATRIPVTSGSDS